MPLGVYVRMTMRVAGILCFASPLQALVLQSSTSLGVLAPEIRLSGHDPKVQMQQQPRLRHKRKICKNKYMRQSLLPSTERELHELNNHLSQHARPTGPRMLKYAEV